MSLSIIELLNDIRAGIFKVSFGDQVQFFNRNSAIQNIIVPEIPIMEDIETSLNIIKYGETVFLWENAIVSERKWKNNKKNRAFMILKNFFTYIIKRYFFKIDHTKIYKEYYKK